MNYALLSDVHGNLHALDAVLADIDRRGDVDAVYHLGDLVGYGAHPDAVVARLQSRGIGGVAGNYDSTVAHRHPHCGCRAETAEQETLAHASYAWTLENTSPATKRLLGALPFRLDLRPLGGHGGGPTVTLVHATPTNNLTYVTEDRSDGFLEKAAASAGLRAGDALCFGHTHRPWMRAVRGIRFVNTGSVGRPKDGDWRAGYVLLQVASAGGIEMEHVRVPYDVDAAATDVRAAGLPAALAEFLMTGGGGGSAGQ